MRKSTAISQETLEQLADQRICDAKALFDSRCYDAAYYIAGFAVECQLKANISTRFRNNEIPDRNLANEVYVHKFLDLINLVIGGKDMFTLVSPLHASWMAATQWKVEARYTLDKSEDDARLMIEAADKVVKWLRFLS